MQAIVPRVMFQVYEPIARVGFRAPELQEACERLGLVAHRMSYYAVRSAALGPVSAEVVSALFYHHTVEMIAPSIPLAWSIASPETIVAARFAAVDRAFRRLLPQQIQSPEMVEAADLAREAIENCSVAGRALFAAHIALEWPTEPHVVLWHALNSLREHRGDGHTSAMLAARLSPSQAAPMLIASTGEDRSGRSWSWPEESWNAAVASLQERGWLNDAGLPTDEGLAARTRIEEETDALAFEPWEKLGADKTHRLWSLLRDIMQPLIDQGAGGPLRTPLGLSWPAQWPG